MYISKVNSKDIVSAVAGLEIRDRDVVAIMIGDGEKPNIDQLISMLNEKGIDFFGGVFPAVIHDDGKYDKGAVIYVLPALAKPFLIRGLDTEKFEMPDFSNVIPEEPGRKYTAMILVDGLASNISLFLGEMFNRLGNSVNYFGGGAGSLSMKKMPCLFTPEGFVSDAAVVTFIGLESKLGVRHGWERIMGPVVATKTKGNVISELNWKNAFQVYKETVEPDSGKSLQRDGFYDIAMCYPFGMMKEGTEDVVRDPIDVNPQGELICVGDVPENTVLSIMRGEKASLIQAAGQAADDCFKEGGMGIKQLVVADCISRSLFLENEFEKELEIVYQKIQSIDNQQTVVGMMTLGEISSYGEGYIEFFNKTIVVGALHEA